MPVAYTELQGKESVHEKTNWFRTFFLPTAITAETRGRSAA